MLNTSNRSSRNSSDRWLYDTHQMKAVALANTSTLKYDSKPPDSSMNKDAKDAQRQEIVPSPFCPNSNNASHLINERNCTTNFWASLKKKGWSALMLSLSKSKTAYPLKLAGAMPHFSLEWRRLHWNVLIERAISWTISRPCCASTCLWYSAQCLQSRKL